MMGAHPPADSAGQPWAGRSFEENPFRDDDGSASPALTAAVAAFRAGTASESEVVDALREARLLIPLVAHLGEAGVNDHGRTVDKSADLSIVSVEGPDGRTVLPVFSSVEAMQRWRSEARPVPADAVRVALAAADEGTELVVLDPMSATEFVVRRPAVWALAQSLPWTPSYRDPEVVAALRDGASRDRNVTDVQVTSGDPGGVLAGPEALVTLSLRPGLSAEGLTQLIRQIQDEWSATDMIAERVDSLGIQVRAAS